MTVAAVVESDFLTPLDSSHVLMNQILHRVSGRGEETYLIMLRALVPPEPKFGSCSR